jgi:hypothetical protein
MRGNVEKALSGSCSRGNGRSWSRLTQLGTSCSAGHAAHQGGLGVQRRQRMPYNPLLHGRGDKGMDEVKKTVEDVLKVNEWLNGSVDFYEGDLTALDKEDWFRDWTEVEDVEELRQKIRNYTGTFKHGKLLFFADHHYGVFVYRIGNGRDYAEHLNPDVSLEKLEEVIRRLDG